MLVQLRKEGAQPATPSEEQVVLVRPAIVSSTGAMSDPVAVPIGLAYLAAMLRQASVPVRVVDATIRDDTKNVRVQDGLVRHGMTQQETVDAVPDGTTIIGISCMFSQDWPTVRKLIVALRERFPDAFFVAGGEHITAVSEYCLRDCPELDVCVRGEGEETLVEVVRNCRARERFAEIQGIAFLEDGKYIETKPRQRIRKVSDIPRPAWDLFPMEGYLGSTDPFGVYRGRSIGIVATRGCPYQCTFCSNPSMYGTAWIARDPDDVLDEIQDYIDQYQITNVDFYDLTMVLKRKWILDFCRRIEERGMSFTWQLPSGTRSEVIDGEVAAALYRTGCRNIAYAPESGSLETLKIIKKKVKLPRLTESIKQSLENGIVVRVNLIIGFPHETREHVLQTLLYAWKLAWIGVHDVGVYQFSPYPGSELFDELQAEGRIPKLDDAYFDSLRNYKSFSVSADYCRSIGPRELTAFRSLTMASFFSLAFALRPVRFAHLIRALAKNQANTALETRLNSILRRKYSRDGGHVVPNAAAI